MTAHDASIDHVDLDTLDDFLSSERAPPDSMALSDLDGFLTAIAIGPELVPPSEWLPEVWGGEAPAFADQKEARAILGSIMGRYNEILRQAADGTIAPIFWVDRDDKPIALDWAKGFLQAMTLRADAWSPLLQSESDGGLLVPILALCGDENGDCLLDLAPEDEDRFLDEAEEFIPACVAAIAAYWRGQGPKQDSMPFTTAPRPRASRASVKVGRNDPCPCGSGRKHKRCCGKTP